jgi:hypothetical protein
MLAFALSTAIAFAQDAQQEKLNALRQYQRERLELSSEVNITGGASTAYMRGPMMGYGGVGFSSGFVVSDPIYTTRTLRVYQAKEPISSLYFFDLIEDEEMFKSVERQAKKYRKRRKIGRVVALLGLGTAVSGWVGVSQASNELEVVVYSNLSLLGSLVGFGGLLGSSFPTSKEVALLRTPLSTMSKLEVENKIDQYNDALRLELGLTVEDVILIESGQKQ